MCHSDHEQCHHSCMACGFHEHVLCSDARMTCGPHKHAEHVGSTSSAARHDSCSLAATQHDPCHLAKQSPKHICICVMQQYATYDTYNPPEDAAQDRAEARSASFGITCIHMHEFPRCPRSPSRSPLQGGLLRRPWRADEADSSSIITNIFAAEHCRGLRFTCSQQKVVSLSTPSRPRQCHRLRLLGGSRLDSRPLRDH